MRLSASAIVAVTIAASGWTAGAPAARSLDGHDRSTIQALHARLVNERPRLDAVGRREAKRAAKLIRSCSDHERDLGVSSAAASSFGIYNSIASARARIFALDDFVLSLRLHNATLARWLGLAQRSVELSKRALVTVKPTSGARMCVILHDILKRAQTKHLSDKEVDRQIATKVGVDYGLVLRAAVPAKQSARLRSRVEPLFREAGLNARQASQLVRLGAAD